MSTETSPMFSDAITRILVAESARLQKTPQDLLSSRNIPAVVWDAATAALQGLNQRVAVGLDTYPESLIAMIEAESKIQVDQRASIARASQASI